MSSHQSTSLKPLTARSANQLQLQNTGASSHAARRLIFHPDSLKNSKIYTGDVLALAPHDKIVNDPTFAIGVAWPSEDAPSDAVYATASHLLSANVRDGDSVQIYNLSSGKVGPGFPSLKDCREAASVALRDNEGTYSGIARKDWLSVYLREVLVDYRYITVGQRILVDFEGLQRDYTVIKISEQHAIREDIQDLQTGIDSLSLRPGPSLWIANWDSQVNVLEPSGESAHTQDRRIDESALPAHTGYDSVGGLDTQISQIRDLIEIPLKRPDLFHHFGLKPPKGILLHGPPGTGKTHLARAIVASTKSSVLVVNGSELSSVYHGETEARLRDVFKEAKSKSPCIVVLDEVDALCPRREDSGGEVERRVVATLLTILDGIQSDSNHDHEDSRVVVIATTNRPNAIDPALRRPGRFDREIEIGIPDANARYSILNVLLTRSPRDISESALRSIASRTHGYVGADLSAVVREAGTIAIKRWLSQSSPGLLSTMAATSLSDSLVQTGDNSQGPSAHMLLTAADLEAGLACVQPSAMREVFIETPQVRWHDIGGQEHVKQKLKECVEWPLLHPEAFERLGVRPPKGVLLYGPPGCSKTLTAKALATESGINFIAVKGPELLNKFVGESERAVREVFRKARAASPSIVFFDEIDALGTSRTADAGNGGKLHEGVLTTLLNEMDGVQELVGVTVVAATNRPDTIDSALMRPGRLDRILYVGPPDYDTRLEILRIRTRKMAVDPTLDLTELVKMTDGCSGAEISAMCQDAALLTMRSDLNAPFVSRDAFLSAAKVVRRQITPDVIAKFESWSKTSGLTSA